MNKQKYMLTNKRPFVYYTRRENMEYIKNNKYFAQVTGSLEKHATEELEALGAEVLQEVSRGVRFQCDKETLYRIVYCSRLITRVLAPLISMQCHSEKYLYNQAFQNINWTELIDIEQCFSIITNVSNSNIRNSLYAGQILKDAICDQFKNKYSKRPNFKPKDGDVVLNLYITDNWATISFDVSGISLHKRGYREFSNTAPMQETLAAAIIKLSNWTGDKPLYDIMCGSGTLLAEALMLYSRIPAGYLRKDEHIKLLPDFDEALWEKVKTEANSQMRECPKGLIYGSDIDEESVEFTKKNLKRLPFGENVEIVTSRFQELSRKENRIIVCNPPYGVRMGSSVSTMYNELGDFLKQRCPHSEAYVLFGKPEMIPELRLRAHWKKTLMNGDIEGKLVKVVLR